MPFHRTGSRYSRWDGAQAVDAMDANDLMSAISDDLMNSGDLDLAMQRMFRWGFERPDGSHMPGLRDLMSRVREQRQQQLDKYDLGSIIDQVREKLDQVLQTERDGINARVEDGRRQLDQRRQAANETQPDGNGDRPDSDGSGAVAPGPDATASASPMGTDEAGAGGGAGDRPEQSDASSDHDDDLQSLLEQMADRKRQQLDRVPDDMGGAISALRDYEFMVPEAYGQFRELLDMLRQQVMDSTYQGLSQSLQGMSSDDVDNLNRMLGDLNEMMEADARGEPTDFEQFQHKWGHYFGSDVQDLDGLKQRMGEQMQAMRQLMDNMSAEQRSELEGLMSAAMNDPETQAQMQRLAQNLGQSMPSDGRRQPLDFSGDESLTLDEASRLMNRMRQYDDLERELQDVSSWQDLANLDDDLLRDLLGEEGGEEVSHLRQLAKVLEDAGYIKAGQRGYELTPQGVRKIGEKALADIFLNLKKDRVGQHELRSNGASGERVDQNKPYEFGDPFQLDLPQTVMNAVQRDGVGSPVRLQPEDFAVYRNEYLTRTATVLMIDMSRSMLYNGCFNAARKVALALDSLIRSQYPRDAMAIIGFSSTAEELKTTDLPTLHWNEHNYGTNMQHGFQLSRQFLARHKGANKQIIVVTDGEPTAHFDESGKVRFNYPPKPATFRETLREVGRATKDGITINTFMMERSLYMVQFIDDLMKINRGRVFAATPGELGEYVLIDYVANKRKRVG
ncbi:MAG TPA: VWA domain-containing protein [Thermomicrobiales bacterium]|jgi:uncharacterized protein with von Willebrand factor type A (vWA) domain|nr:VWA domain-containing protein [Thermomicrobiales bacterium]